MFFKQSTSEKKIINNYGFNPESLSVKKITETKHFILYQILPYKNDVFVDKNKKPVLLIPPYVFGPDILCFIPQKNRSLVHAYANKCFPTYLRVLKDIESNCSVQNMRAEDDIIGTQKCLEKIKELHSKKITLVGVSQGGTCALYAVLSGKIDGLIDALSTIVTPITLVREKKNHVFKLLRNIYISFIYIKDAVVLIFRFLKRYNNGNWVINKTFSSWLINKKKSMVLNFSKDLFSSDKEYTIPGKSAVDLVDTWLTNSASDIPIKMARFGYCTYIKPVLEDGTLVVKVFDRKLNFKYINKLGIKYQICICKDDHIVKREDALIPCNFVDAEVTEFPKGHMAIMTTWSNPSSEYSVDKRFGDRKQYRGPVRFHMDLDEEA
ncbi:MAG TPA: hypothetical protein QF753_06440 [Victivallales bacterium]|nr:hypothetical protein [Victivallales bacterium]